MHSRVSLSLIAMVFGAAVLYILQVYNIVIISTPEQAPSMGTTVIVLIGGLIAAIGWIRIFRRRPKPRPDAASEMGGSS